MGLYIIHITGAIKLWLAVQIRTIIKIIKLKVYGSNPKWAGVANIIYNRKNKTNFKHSKTG